MQCTVLQKNLHADWSHSINDTVKTYSVWAANEPVLLMFSLKDPANLIQPLDKNAPRFQAFRQLLGLVDGGDAALWANQVVIVLLTQ